MGVFSEEWELWTWREVAKALAKQSAQRLAEELEAIARCQLAGFEPAPAKRLPVELEETKPAPKNLTAALKAVRGRGTS